MDYHLITRCVAAVVWFMLFQCACSVPILKQSASRMSEREKIHKRSAPTVEFLMNRDTHKQFQTRTDPLEGVALASEQDFDDLLCPLKVSTGLNDPNHKRSTCPWYYRASRDAKRFPAVVLNAEPLCDYAIGSNNAEECVAITQSMTVLKQQNYADEHGNLVWKEETMTVILGYTSAGRRLAENSPQSTTAAPANQPEWAKR
ncbi:uncharacterized protein LOC123534014 [Mercenaria mercenaria]|uniref:uncharacterized protein LOC123534014 n=1 Tax=Mercenaria mercenaria TaxID=6596 RepID=UPI00234EFDB8|nr:uncharacterized protein LOC123534014 [Mercenaria mercenaria]